MKKLEEMCKEYNNIIYKYLFCITHNKEIAEDLTQETLYKALKNIRSFRGDCKINTWLCKIAKNEWYMYLNKNKKHKMVSIDEAITISNGENLDDKITSNDLKRRLYKEIYKLDNEVSQIMLLRLEDDMSFKEIGEIFNKNETWARVKFFRGKQKIKEGLRDERQEIL